MASAISGSRAHTIVSERAESRAVSVVPHEPAPSTALFTDTTSGTPGEYYEPGGGHAMHPERRDAGRPNLAAADKLVNRNLERISQLDAASAANSNGGLAARVQ